MLLVVGGIERERKFISSGEDYKKKQARSSVGIRMGGFFPEWFDYCLESVALLLGGAFFIIDSGRIKRMR
jgi:hypothetical protein